MIAGLTATGGAGRSVAVEPGPAGEPFPRPRLGVLDPVGLAVVIVGDLVQRRGDILHAAAGGEAPAFVREGAQRGGALVHRPVAVGCRRRGAIMSGPSVYAAGKQKRRSRGP